MQCIEDRRPVSRTRRALLTASLVLALLALGHEVFRTVAPQRYEVARAWLWGGTSQQPADPRLPPTDPQSDPRILRYTNTMLKLTVSPVGAEARVANHQANGVVATTTTVPASGQVELLLPDDPDVQYGLLVLKAGYHEYKQPVKPGAGTFTILLEKPRGEVEFRSTECASSELRHVQGERRSAGPIPPAGQLLAQSLDEGDWAWQIARRDCETNSGRLFGLVHGRRQTVTSPLKPLPGRLSVVGHATMEVWEGTSRLGRANDWIPLAAGAHDLELRRPGFRPQPLQVDLPPNRDLSRDAGPFEPETGALRLTVEPPQEVADRYARAAKRLILDGATSSVPALPHLLGDLSAGSHQVRIEIDGFPPVERAGVVVEDARTNELHLQLQPLPARLTVVSDPTSAEVFRASGDRLGWAGSRIEIPPGKALDIGVWAGGYETAPASIPAPTPAGQYRHEARLTRPTRPVLASVTKDNPWLNSLQMKFVRLPDTDVLICLWPTRVQDFQAFVKSTGHVATNGMFSVRKDGVKQRGDSWRSPGFSQGPTHPVVGVSYDDAMTFCEWLTKRDRAAGLLGSSQSYRLPTDAEWSLAVGDTLYPWGNQWPPPEGSGNYAGQEAADANWPDDYDNLVLPSWRDQYPRTAPVDAFRSNRLGLHIGGNALEWCSDWYRKSMNTDETRRAHTFLDQDQVGTARVLRGASWSSDTRLSLASGYRTCGPPASRYVSVGFRVVLGGSAR